MNVLRNARILLGLAVPLTMAACSQGGYFGFSNELDRLKTETPTGSAFSQNLSKDYLALANTNRDEYNWPVMSLYAHKGMEAAHGAGVEPERVEDWSYVGIQLGGVNGTFFQPDAQAGAPLNEARGRLVAMLGSGAPNRFPEWAATAQTKFDCWLEATHEALDPIGKADACRKGFEDAMASINGQKMAAAPAAAPAPAPPAIATNGYQVFFDFDKSNLSPEARRIIASAAQAIKAGNGIKVKVTGYTDTVGTVQYNIKLSFRRADAVERELVRDGVAAASIAVDGKGKSELLVQTPDGTREPRNRRATVELAQ